ncbi:MAG: dsDNA nuclease domain-containing protein [Gammaproteobacteria bacterium]|nr:dsDNA nuclease domain-containing protein [Gammaproteobacteria bacterium]
MSDGDWGSDTFARFRYQAEVTLPYCVSAALSENDIVAVVPEHKEDIALETGTGWRFLQVKSRNPERGLWQLSDLLVKGGALRSLYRTYLLTTGQERSLELVLEGAVKPKDRIEMLRRGEDRSELVPTVAEKLGLCTASAEGFLSIVTLNEAATHRNDIHASNARLLHQHAPSLTQPEVETLHNALLAEIEKAMRSDRMGALWPRSVVHPQTRSTVMDERRLAKTLHAERLAGIAEVLSAAGRPLLKRLVERGSRPASPLTQKLVVGGATEELIEQARNLKANADHHRFVRASQNLASDEALTTDLHERIRTYAYTAVAMHGTSDQPAIKMWAYLLDTFGNHAKSIDRNNLVRRDPMLLMGEGCILSHQCEFTWGGS